MKMFPNNNPVLVPFLSAVKTQFIFLYCYISPEIGYLFSWTSLKAKTGPLCCCVSVEVDGRGKKKSNPRLPTGRALTGGTDSHRMWLPLQGRPLWWGSWRFSHRVRKAHGSPVGIRHPSAGFSLRGCGVRKQMTLNVGHESADPVMAQPQWQLWLTSRLMHHVQNKLLRLVLHLHGHKRRQFLAWMWSGRLLFQLASWITAYPELVKQQVEDLSRRHGAVDSHVGDRTIGRGKYRRLKKKREKWWQWTFWLWMAYCHFNSARWDTKKKQTTTNGYTFYTFSSDAFVHSNKEAGTATGAIQYHFTARCSHRTCNQA